MIACVAAAVLITSPFDLGSRRELFVDRHLIESMEGVTLEIGTLHDEGPVFQFDKPWEGPFCGYSTVIKDGDRYMLFYRGLPKAGGDGSNIETTCLALSNDGIEWTRPNLGLFEVNGTKANNVILANAAPVTHNFSPFLDSREGIDPDEKFKGLGGTEASGLIAYTSPDGVNWKRLRQEPVVTGGMFDSQNVSFWSESEQLYVCYLRTWTGGGYSGLRSISRSTSSDFINWTKPEQMMFDGGQTEHYYTSQTQPYFRAPHIYVATAARFMPGRQVVSAEEANQLGVNPSYFRDCSDAVLLTSRGSSIYRKDVKPALIRPGIGLENWVSRSNYPALNIVQTGRSEMSLYVNQNYAQPTAALHRYSMRLDGLASVSAKSNRGSFVTRPVRFAGDQLELNLATSAAGGIKVEIQDEQGRPLPGYGAEDCVEVIGNEIAKTVRWKGQKGVGSLAGRTVRLKFELADADLYSFRFKAAE